MDKKEFEKYIGQRVNIKMKIKDEVKTFLNVKISSISDYGVNIIFEQYDTFPTLVDTNQVIEIYK